MKAFLEGIESLLDGFVCVFSFGTITSIRPMEEKYPFLQKTDAEAIEDDWRVVGDTMKEIIGEWPIETRGAEEARE